MDGLIELAKSGDKEAFIELIENIKQDLFKIARTRLSNYDDIEDAVQETMIEAFKNIKKLQKNEKFKTWIITILINRCNKIYRKRKKYNISFENLEFENYFFENQIDEYENELEFYRLLNVLNYEERIVVLLFYKEDYSLKLISKVLKVNENTVKTRLKRAKEKIKRFYERNGF